MEVQKIPSNQVRSNASILKKQIKFNVASSVAVSSTRLCQQLCFVLKFVWDSRDIKILFRGFKTWKHAEVVVVPSTQ